MDRTSSNPVKPLPTRFLNGWPLFWIVSAPMSLIMLVAMLRADMSTPVDVSHMISFSVRWAVPLIYLVVAASAVHTLFPHPFTLWWLRNRKYIGLCFAIAMAWQGLFIFIMSTVFRDYYYDEIFLLRDELEGSTGYLFLAAMVVTSFRFGRKYLNSKQWKLLHRSGMYFLWAYPFSVYWWALFYYGNPVFIDYVFYWAGFTAFALRIFAWGKRRRMDARRDTPAVSTPLPLQLAGAVVVAFGLLAAATGGQWREAVNAFLTAPDWSATLVLWLPFWPFEPFLPLAVVGVGVTILTLRRNEARAQAAAVS